MGLFDGILICSDVDGTFALGENVPPRNLEAIRRFQAEGGRFTLATGRPVGYQDIFPIRLNAPLISENGTRISDPETGRTLWTFPLDGCGSLLEWLDLPETPDRIKVSMWFENGSEFAGRGGVAEKFSSHTGGDLLKIICHNFSDEGAALSFRDEARAVFGDRYDISRSWNTGVEFVSPLGGKGNCLNVLRTICEDTDKIIAVGDYENDLSMFRTADWSFAPANACPEVLSAARTVVCPCSDGSIGAVIEAVEASL